VQEKSDKEAASKPSRGRGEGSLAETPPNGSHETVRRQGYFSRGNGDMDTVQQSGWWGGGENSEACHKKTAPEKFPVV